MALHPNIRYLHIGCDEVFHIAECSLCQRKFKDDIFLGHVQRVATYVRNKLVAIQLADFTISG